MAADQAQAQVDPGVAKFDAFLAHVRLGCSYFDLIKVSTFLWHRALRASAHRITILDHTAHNATSKLGTGLGTGELVRPTSPGSTALRTYSAMSKLSANGHSPSTHCASQRNPAFPAIWKTSSGEYLWLLSVQIVSPSRNSTLNAAAGMFTVCARAERKRISTLRASWLILATCAN